MLDHRSERVKTFCLIVSFQDTEDGPSKDHADEVSLRDPLSEELKQSETTSAVDQTHEAGIVKTHGESTALNQTTDDLQERQESDNSSLSNDTQQSDSKLVTHERTDQTTDCSDKVQNSSGEIELKSEKTLPEEKNLKVVKEEGLGPHLSSEKKLDLSRSKTDASQIIADVVESIEQESAPPVAPPRRRKKKKKAEGELQVSTDLTSRESWWPMVIMLDSGLSFKCWLDG